MYQASDKHRGEWPAGVRIKAVVPIAVVVGSCDAVATEYAKSYVDDARDRNKTGIYAFTVHGANQSPKSGQVGAIDDVQPDPSVPAGQCRIGSGATPDRRLTEDQ